MASSEIKDRLTAAARELRDCMNEYGQLGFSVDVDVSHLSLYEIDGKTLIHHEVSLDISEDFRV